MKLQATDCRAKAYEKITEIIENAILESMGQGRYSVTCWVDGTHDYVYANLVLELENNGFKIKLLCKPKHDFWNNKQYYTFEISW